jgi:sulfur relay (sulfurtransferase) DsrC/TusE family protein
MPTFEANGNTYAVDEDGFLENPEIWNEDVAKDFAASEGVDELYPKILSGIRHRPDDSETLQRERFQAE